MINFKLNKRHIVKAVIPFWLLLIACTADAQSLSTTIDRKDILIGEPIHYSLKFVLPGNNFKAQFLVPDSITHFEIMASRSKDTLQGGSLIVRQDLKLTSWDSGRWYIPKLPIKVMPANGTSPYTAYTDEIEVNVGYAQEDSTGQLRDIKSVIHVPYVDRSWLLLALGLIVALAIIGFLIWYFVKNKKSAPPLYHSSLSPYDEAIKDLEALKKLNLQQPDDIKKFHSSITDIFKKYFSRKRQKNYMNQTTGDILVSMKAEGSPTETIATLAESLRYSDAVKFAKYLPEANDSLYSIQRMKKAIGFIEEQSKKATQG